MVRTARVFEDPQVAADRQTNSLAALALTLALIVLGLYLVNVLRDRAEFQDCLLSGRPECPRVWAGDPDAVQAPYAAKWGLR